MKKLAIITMLLILAGCTNRTNNTYDPSSSNVPKANYDKSQLAGQYRAFHRHGYDWVAITEAGEVVFDDSETKERIVYKYTIEGDSMMLRRTGEDKVWNCLIKEVNDEKIIFNTYPGLRECPIASQVDYLTRTD